jgi:hypothetical protein
MKRQFPSLALVWMYKGADRPRRRQQIEALEYPAFEIIEVLSHGNWGDQVRATSPGSEVYILWVDDDKPVAKNFLHEMTLPLFEEGAARAAAHFWSGNALAVPGAALTDKVIKECAGSTLLLKVILPVLDAVKDTQRVNIAFSSLERLAPLHMDPVGYPS